MARDTAPFAADVRAIVNALGGTESAMKTLGIARSKIEDWKTNGVSGSRAAAAQRYAGVPAYLDIPPFRFCQGWAGVRATDGVTYHVPSCTDTGEPLYAIHGWKQFATEQEIRDLLCDGAA